MIADARVGARDDKHFAPLVRPAGRRATHVFLEKHCGEVDGRRTQHARHRLFVTDNGD